MNHQPSTISICSLGLRLSLVLAALCAPAGCVRRTVEIDSDPPGAELVVNGQPAGVTPVKMSFRHHGTYRVELRKEGFAPLTAGLRLRGRLYELPPLEPAAELLWPAVIRDGRSAHYKLEPLPPVDRARTVAAARAAAAEAERLIPRLYEAPPPGKWSRDRALLPGPKAPKDAKERSSEPDADGLPGK